MFENISNVMSGAVGGTGRIVAGTSIQYTGAGIRKVGELLVAGGSWLEAKGAVMAARGKAVKMVANGQLTVLGAAALAAGQSPIEVMISEILSGQPLNLMGSQPATVAQQTNHTAPVQQQSEEVEEIPPAQLANDLC